MQQKLKKTKLVIIGIGSFAEVAYEYFTYDSSYQVVGFAIEKDYLTKNVLFNLPVIDLVQINIKFSPQNHSIFVAIGFEQLNRIRTKLYLELKKKGYKIASYVSSRSMLWRDTKIGEHVFIGESCVIQPFVNISNNVILWGGCYVAHHTNIYENCFIATQAIILGKCVINKNCFIGANATIAHKINIAEDCIISMGSTMNRNSELNNVYKGNPAMICNTNARNFML